MFSLYIIYVIHVFGVLVIPLVGGPTESYTHYYLSK